MSGRHHDFLSPDRAEGDIGLQGLDKFDPRREAALANADEAGPLTAADRDQLEREIAAIEHASAALRRADPEMESWIAAPPATMHKPRPVWLLIGVLWLSTALVTIGAVFAISALVG